MKVLALLLVICLVGAFCHKHHHEHHHEEQTVNNVVSDPAPASGSAASGSMVPEPPVASGSAGSASQPPAKPKVHNRIRIQFDGVDHHGWLMDCLDSQMEDSPTGCSAYPHHTVNSNTTHSTRQQCARKCQLNDEQIQLLSKKEQRKKIKIEAWDYDVHHSHKAHCELTWSQDSFLVGYNLQVHYLWVDHVETPFVEVKSCQVEAIVSSTPPQTGDEFISSRELVLDGRINFLAAVLSMSLMGVALTLMCCAMTCCVSCLCVKVCRGSQASRRRACRLSRRRCSRSKKASSTNCKKANQDVEMDNLVKSIPQQQAPPAQSGFTPSPIPMYVPYYMYNPYSAPMFAQQTGNEQTFVMPQTPQQ